MLIAVTFGITVDCPTFGQAGPGMRRKDLSGGRCVPDLTWRALREPGRPSLANFAPLRQPSGPGPFLRYAAPPATLSMQARKRERGPRLRLLDRVSQSHQSS